MLKDLYQGTVPLITAQQVVRAQQLPKHLKVLDAREREEYEVSHLPGAVWVGYENLQQDRILCHPKDQPFLLYCSVGLRSERVGERLRKMGYTEVYNLYGGMFEWMNQGFPVHDAQGHPTDRVHVYNWRWSKWALSGKRVYGR